MKDKGEGTAATWGRPYEGQRDARPQVRTGVFLFVWTLPYMAGAAVPKKQGNWLTPILDRLSPEIYLMAEGEMVL